MESIWILMTIVLFFMFFIYSIKSGSSEMEKYYPTQRINLHSMNDVNESRKEVSKKFQPGSGFAGLSFDDRSDADKLVTPRLPIHYRSEIFPVPLTKINDELYEVDLFYYLNNLNITEGDVVYGFGKIQTENTDQVALKINSYLIFDEKNSKNNTFPKGSGDIFPILQFPMARIKLYLGASNGLVPTLKLEVIIIKDQFYSADFLVSVDFPYDGKWYKLLRGKLIELNSTNNS